MLSGTCASLALGCATTTLSSGERFLLGEEAEVVMPSSTSELIFFRKKLLISRHNFHHSMPLLTIAFVRKECSAGPSSNASQPADKLRAVSATDANCKFESLSSSVGSVSDIVSPCTWRFGSARGGFARIALDFLRFFGGCALSSQKTSFFPQNRSKRSVI